MRRILGRNHEPQVSCDGPIFWSSPERDERKEQTGQRVGSSNIIMKEDGMERNSTIVVRLVNATRAPPTVFTLTYWSTK